MEFPRLASRWRRIVEYPSRHLNDFCLFQDREGTWHAIGIVGTGTWASEQSLFHAAGHSLDEPFERLPDVLTEPAPAGVAPQKHAPFAIEWQGAYHLFYRRPSGTILVVRSEDPYEWVGLGEVVFEERDARDVCIVPTGGEFLMYYCQSHHVEGVARSTVLLRPSADLRRWGEPTVVHVDTQRPAEHSYLESPYVIARHDGYYLFARCRLLDQRTVTTVYHSPVPDRFPSGEHAWFAELEGVHAPELVRQGDEWYIARVSGPPHAGPHGVSDRGYVDVARLLFD